MIRDKIPYQIEPTPETSERLKRKAEEAMGHPLPHITDEVCPLSAGSSHDYYSNGDYWWPNAETADGLPYVRKDGMTNPCNFNEHRTLLRTMRTDVVWLASGYERFGDRTYGKRAEEILTGFFLNPETCMNPNLDYAQAIPGVCPGRGIGLIDTLHLADVVFAVEKLWSLKGICEDCYQGIRRWFSAYIDWMLTSENGVQEMQERNNHSIAFFVQLAAFACFTDRREQVAFCREQYKSRLLLQVAADGSFPLELARTKPYNYSVFALDNLVTICMLLSCPEENLWDYETEAGVGIRQAVKFMLPYLRNKELWPYPRDVMHFDSFPARNSMMLFAGCTLGIQELLDLYAALPEETKDEEVRRNVAVRNPLLWM